MNVVSRLLEGAHASFVEKVLYKSMAAFTTDMDFGGLNHVSGTFLPLNSHQIVTSPESLYTGVSPGTPRNPFELSFRWFDEKRSRVRPASLSPDKGQ
ncbi:hypothetical protein YC2023_016954 [Brassica napus]